jgi:hypothetical protein
MADEYIRRDAAMKAVASQYGACRSPAQNRLLDEIRNKIRRMPAADVAEVALPCKVGDTVYFVNAKQILEFAVVGYAVDDTGISWVHSEHVDKTGHTNERTFSPDRFGKNTFLTREEAERAMQEMEDKA